ncbi:MAG: hypothetical protein HY673_01390 [Chloroflexi bacterium]|nr:hypothetical protein [Chloroflexota bacterium]
MEKIAEERREPEPVQFDSVLEANQFRRARDAQKAASLPRILKSVDVPWTMGIMAFHRHWIGSAPTDRLARVMTVSSYRDQQHFNSNQKQKARMWYSISPLVEVMAVRWTKQLEMRSGFVAFQSRWYSFIGRGPIEHPEDAPTLG